MKILKHLLSLRAVLLLWFSQAVSSAGTAMTRYALIIWTYGEHNTAISITLLSVFSYLPAIVLSSLGGVFADRWNKKKIMLFSDLFAACGTVVIFILISTNALTVWHLYVINFMISFAEAFQKPAAYVAVSLITPKNEFVRMSGLQILSTSLVGALAPSLASMLLSIGGLQLILIVDIVTFLFAFIMLAGFINISDTISPLKQNGSFLDELLAGFKYIWHCAGLLKLISFLGFINLIAYMTGYGILPAMLLARGGNTALTTISTVIAISSLAGSVIVTLIKPVNNRRRLVLLSLIWSFLLNNLPLGLNAGLAVWSVSAFVGNLPLPIMSAQITAAMRVKIPLDLQGRVFAARDTLQYATIPLGLILGGFLADHCFEPLMSGASTLAQMLIPLVGHGSGAGMGLMFVLSGLVGTIASLIWWRLSRNDSFL